MKKSPDLVNSEMVSVKSSARTLGVFKIVTSELSNLRSAPSSDSSLALSFLISSQKLTLVVGFENCNEMRKHAPLPVRTREPVLP